VTYDVLHQLKMELSVDVNLNQDDTFTLSSSHCFGSA